MQNNRRIACFHNSFANCASEGTKHLTGKNNRNCEYSQKTAKQDILSMTASIPVWLNLTEGVDLQHRVNCNAMQ